MKNLFLIAAPFAIGSLAQGCGDSQSPPEARQTVRNVLLVTLDTTRADRFSCYGYDRPTTPNFDALAAEGVLFELAISTAGATPIAHASILTGLNPYHHGVRVIYAGSGYYLHPEIPTLASVLHDKGWDTGAFLSSFTVSEFYGFDHGFNTFDNGLKNPAENVLEINKRGRARWDVGNNQRRSDETADAAIAWLAKERKSPFFAWIHFWDPHDGKLSPPESVLARFPARNTSNKVPEHHRYDAEIAYVDQNFGRVVQTLKQSGQYDHTIIVVIADHGTGLGDHDWITHRLLYQEQIRLPLIVRVPGGAKGVRIPELVRNIDVYPTVMQALNIELPRKPDGQPIIDGRSMIGLMSGKSEPARIAYADQLNQWDTNAGALRRRPLDQLIYCAMDKSWKLIYRAGAESNSLLYHIAEDPHEVDNLYRPDHEQTLRLKAELDRFNGYRKVPFAAGANDAARRRLEEMGYIGRDDADQPAPPAGQPTSAPGGG